LSYTYKVTDGVSYYDLPDWQDDSVGYDFCQVGSFKGTYKKGGVNSDQLVDNAVVIAYWNGVEYPNSRFKLLASEGSSTKEQDSFTVYGKSLLDVFRKVVVYPNFIFSPDPSTPDPIPTPVKYPPSTPGGILNNLFTIAQTRGAMTGLTWGFSDTLDSAGNPWDYELAIEYKVGTKYLEIIRNFVDNGIVEIELRGTEIYVVRESDLGSDLTLGDTPLELRAGLDYEEIPYKWSVEERVNRSILAGDEGGFVEDTSIVAPMGPFGMEEQAMTQSGTLDPNYLNYINEKALEKVEVKREEFTRKITIRPDGPAPLVDYSVGDWILDRSGEAIGAQRYRVRTLAIESTGGETTCSITLNDKFLEQEIITARRLEAITGGLTGAEPSPPPDGLTFPMAPESIFINSDTYYDSSYLVKVLASISWVAPTLNTDLSNLTNLDGYDVEYRVSESGIFSDPVETDPIKFWRSLGVGGAASNYANIGGLNPGWWIQVRVRARNNDGAFSDWLTSAITQLTPDLDPPEKPSDPIVTSRLGTITVKWDHLDHLGNPMAPDFERVDVRMVSPGYDSGGGYVIPAIDGIVGSLRNTSETDTLVIVDNLPLDASDVTITFIAYDRAGNASVESDFVNIEVLRVQGPDITANSITTNHITAGSITSALIEATAINGKTITGAFIRTALSGARVELLPTGIKGYNAGGVETFGFDTATGYLTALGAIIYGSIYAGPDAGTQARLFNGNAEFYDAGSKSAMMGEFAGRFYNYLTEAWNGDTVRGIALWIPGGTNPFFQVGQALTAGSRQMVVGAGDSVETIQLRATGRARMIVTNSSITCLPSGISIDTDASQPIEISSAHRLLLNAAENINMEIGGGAELKMIGIGTTPDLANMVLTGSNNVKKTSSSLRYKTDVEPAEVKLKDAKALMGLSRTWIDKGEKEKDPSYSKRSIGYIAEELAEHDTLNQFVIYENNRPESVAYAALSIASMVLIKDLYAQVEELKKK
jgi:hypothetical protein